MSQEPYKNDKKLPKFSNRPNEGGDNTPRKGPRFSIYWVYAIIFAVLIGFQLFGGSLTSSNNQIDQTQFDQMLKQQDVDKYIIISNRNKVRVKLKNEAIPKWEGKIGKNLKPA